MLVMTKILCYQGSIWLGGGGGGERSCELSRVGGPRASSHRKIYTTVDILPPLEFLGPLPGKFVVGVGRDLSLQPMARTNHKFPKYGGPGNSKECEINRGGGKLESIFGGEVGVFRGD